MESFIQNSLGKCQVDTPIDVVQNTWDMITKYRDYFDKVLDLGASDARFSKFGTYKSYTGIEIDKGRMTNVILPDNAKIINKCAFELRKNNFDLCIGNPPYIKRMDIDNQWQQKVIQQLSRDMNCKFDLRANIYLYFLAQAMLKTNKKGLVVQIIPYEWVSRPSAKPIRDYINKHNWNVHVYRFSEDIFPRVLTTASVSVIDKKNTQGKWQFYTISKNFKYKKIPYPSGDKKVLAYSNRDPNLYAQRGISPGSQVIFCLNETDRKKFGLKKFIDVTPCVTSLKSYTKDEIILNKENFDKYFVNTNMKCWLIKTYANPSKKLQEYLKSVKVTDRNTWTCNQRQLWWRIPEPKIPRIIYASGFTRIKPKILLNKVNAVVAGSVHGIHYNDISTNKILEELNKIDYESQIISHSGVLKKIEVKQMNSVLKSLKI